MNFFEIKVTVSASSSDAAALAESIKHLLCPDPNHPPPCPIPWEMSIAEVDSDAEGLEDLRTQVESEGSRERGTGAP